MLRKIQRNDKKENRSRAIERGSVLNRNIGKVVRLCCEAPIGEPCASFSSDSININANELVAKLAAVGLTGNSGSGFPTSEKIKAFCSSAAENKYIVINGAECEPGLLYRYNGQKGNCKWKGLKWSFYIYYPLHLTLIGLLRLALQG